MSTKRQNQEKGLGLSPEELLQGTGQPRLRASFSGLIGILVMAIAVFIRFSYEPTSAEIAEGKLIHTATCLGLVSVCLLAVGIAKPRDVSWWNYGTWPLAGLLALALPFVAPLQLEANLQLYLLSIETSACLLLLLSLFAWLSGQSIRRTSLEILNPKARARCLMDEKIKPIVVSSITQNTEIVISAGDDVPVDGVLISGSGFVDEKMVFGSELPEAKQPGDVVFAGSNSTIPDGVVRSESFLANSYIVRRRLMERILLRLIHRPMPLNKVLTMIACLCMLIFAGFSWTKVTAASWTQWCGILSGLFLTGTGVVSLSLLARSRSESLRHGSQAGILFSKLRDLEIFGQVSRWQIDPRLLLRIRKVQAHVLEESYSHSKLLQIAQALTADVDESLAFALQEHFTTQDVPKLRAAALKNINGVFHGTVRGERWWLASKGAINTQKTEIVTEEHETAISGITSDDDMVWYVGQPDKEVVGVIVFRIEVDLSIGKLAKNLDMSLMPGLPDSLREIVSSLSGIPKEKGPIGRTGGSLLLDSSPRPSAGLRLVVVEPKLDIEVERGRSPRITRQALSNLKSYLESQRRCSKTRRWASVIGTFAHVGLGCLLTILGWFGPWTASVLVGGVMLFSVNSLMNASGPEDTSIVP